MEELLFNTKADPTVRAVLGKDAEEYVAREKAPRKKRVFSEEKVKELAQTYQVVCVHDYGDEYHLSDDEREKRNKYYQAFNRLRRQKRKFRKLDDYVKAFRISMDTLDLVANDNGLYDPEVFKKRVFSKKTEVFGLTFPKYIGKDKKLINWEMVMEYVMDRSLNPNELTAKMGDKYEEMSDSEAFDTIFTKRLQQGIMDAIDEINSENESGIIRPVSFDEENEPGIVTRLDKKESKQIFKDSPTIFRAVKNLDKREKKLQAIQTRLGFTAFDLDRDDYSEIERMDANRRLGKVSSKAPKFKGSVMNKKDVKRFMYQSEVYEQENTIRSYRGKNRTLDEIRELDIKDGLEEAGWNLRKMGAEKKERKKMKKAYKESQDRDAAIRNRLLALQKGGNKKVSKLEFNSKKKKKNKGKKSKRKEGD